jgi:Cu+-exporting ATPase
MGTEHLSAASASRVIELDVEGMTCASCVNRVEKKLAKLEGVEATVNLPLETAHVTVPAGITDQQITDQVASAGYKARIKTVTDEDHDETLADASPHHEDHMAHGGKASELKPRLLVAAVLAVPVFLISMFPAFQFPQLGLGGGRPGAAGGQLGGVAVPQGGRHQRPPPRLHDGPPSYRSGSSLPTCSPPGNSSPTRA